MDIESALAIAIQAHLGQKDKCGDPYILHPLFVMNRVETMNEKVVAVLHDVIEDCGVQLSLLKDLGLTEIQSEALNFLTKEKKHITQRLYQTFGS